MSVTGIYTSIPTDMVDFVYREPVTNKFKSKTSYIVRSNSDPSRPRYQLATKDDARLKAPYGISKPFDEKQQDSDRKSLDMSIESEALLSVLSALDDHNVKVAFENCEKWFGKKLPIEHIKFMYRPIVTHDKNKKYKPTFRTKINVKADADNATRFLVAEEVDGVTNYKEEDSSIITKGVRLVPIVELGSLWFSSTQFGMSLECTDVLVFPVAQREKFPFQGWEGKPVPMETDDASVPPPSASQEGSSAPSSTQQQSWVPPAEPHAV